MSKTTYRASARLALGGLIVAISCGTALAGDVFTPCGDSALPGLADSRCAIRHMPLRPDDPEGAP